MKTISWIIINLIILNILIACEHSTEESKQLPKIACPTENRDLTAVALIRQVKDNWALGNFTQAEAMLQQLRALPNANNDPLHPEILRLEALLTGDNKLY